jgi:signal transduction histidine kinase
MGGARRVKGIFALLGARAFVLDVMAAVALTVGALVHLGTLKYQTPVIVVVIVCVLCTAPVALRHRNPWLAVIWSLTFMVLYQRLTHDQNMLFEPFALILSYYTLGTHSMTRRDLERLAALIVYGLAGCALIAANAGGLSLSGLVSHAAILVIVPAVVGIAVVWRWSLTDRLAAAHAQLAIEHELRLWQVAVEERNRVARDVHDVVAHGVSVMVIQAGAARLNMALQPQTARAALKEVARSGREAMADLRRIMGVLRDEDSTPGIDRLASLIDGVSASGLVARLYVEGRPVRIEPDRELVVYRVVQEALTNVVKHAPHASTQVRLDFGVEALEVRVTNSQVAAASPDQQVTGSGRGLIGMRERVSIYGGAFAAGPLPAGGYEVYASIPLTSLGSPRHGPGLDADTGPRRRRWAAARRRFGVGAVVLVAFAMEFEVALSPDRRGPVLLNAVLVAAMALAMLVGRRMPLLFLITVEVLAVPLSHGLTGIDAPTVTSAYVMLVPLLAVAIWCPWQQAVIGLMIVLGEGVSTGLYWQTNVTSVVGAVLVAIAVWSVGRVIRSQRLLIDELGRASRDLASERKDRERLALSSERTRIVRELHSHVADGVVAMVVHAEVIAEQLDRDPDGALEEIAVIERTGREALTQMRGILGLLQAPHDPIDLQPTPGLAHIHSLLQRWRAEGRPIDLRVSGEPGPLFGGVDVVTYRVVEQLLRETDRPGCAPMAITIDFRPNDLELGVEVPGPLSVGWPSTSVQERVAMVLGEIRATTNGFGDQRLIITLPRNLDALPV